MAGISIEKKHVKKLYQTTGTCVGKDDAMVGASVRPALGEVLEPFAPWAQVSGWMSSSSHNGASRHAPLNCPSHWLYCMDFARPVGGNEGLRLPHGFSVHC